MKLTRPTQADVAREAGVSISTVSRALSGEAGISPSVQAEIREAAKRLGYSRRTETENDRGRPGAALTFDVLLHAERATSDLGPFYQDILAGLQAAAEERRCRLNVSLLGAETLGVDHPALAAPASDGLFLVGLDLDADAADHVLAKRLCVVLTNGADPAMRFDCVAPSNFYGGALATRTLLDAGHRAIAYIGGTHRDTIRERVRGFRSEIDATADARGHTGVLTFEGRTFDEAAAAITRVLDADPGVTAAFCMNDAIALGVLHALEKTGRRAPEDVSVIGFDDLPCATMMSPRLSTVRVDRAAIGFEAMRLMQQRVAAPDMAAQQVLVGVRLVAGGTIGIGPAAR